MKLLKEGLKAMDILSDASFRNAVVVHQATGGSTNALLHLPAIAHAAGIEFDASLFDTIGQKVPYLTNIHTAGQYSSRQFWHAGGVQRIVALLRDSGLLDMGALTVTAETVGKNVEKVVRSDFFRAGEGCLGNYATIDGSGRLNREEVIRAPDDPRNRSGSVAIMKGNLAPMGSVFKYSACDPAMYEHTGRAVVFNCEEDCYRAITQQEIDQGSVVVVGYEGPRGSGMPELYYVTAAAAGLEKYRNSIALVENEDLIEISLRSRSINIVGVQGRMKEPEEMRNILEQRRTAWQQPAPKYAADALGLYCRLAASAMEGAYMS